MGGLRLGSGRVLGSGHRLRRGQGGRQHEQTCEGQRACAHGASLGEYVCDRPSRGRDVRGHPHASWPWLADDWRSGIPQARSQLKNDRGPCRRAACYSAESGLPAPHCGVTTTTRRPTRGLDALLRTARPPAEDGSRSRDPARHAQGAPSPIGGRGISSAPHGSSCCSGSATWGLITIDTPWIWIPLAVVQGFTVFNFTVLLHEVVHSTIFQRRRARADRLLGFLYAIPSGISPTQFTRWHLDHHAELGSDEHDPKRHHLSPKTNWRLVKALYMTPALFPIYFRAARAESSTYPRRRAGDASGASACCRWPRTCRCSAAIWIVFGVAAALRAYVVPVFFIFPDRVHAQPARAALRHRSRPTRPSGARCCAATGSGTWCS